MLLANYTNALSATAAETFARAGQGGVDVDVDATVFVQVLLFVFLLIVLKPLLFDPMLKLFEAREAQIDGAKKIAREIDKRSAGAQATYEAEMNKARNEANAERERLRAEGAKTENEILSKVRAATTQTLDEGRARVQQEAAAVRTKLRADSAQLGRELASRILGREVSG